MTRSGADEARSSGELVAPRTGPTVLLAVDGDAMSESVARTADRLFGETATYLAINVGQGPYSDLSWAYVWPVGGGWIPMLSAGEIEAESEAGTQRAVARAKVVTDDAGLAQATPIGAVGDVASAIIRAAHHHRADVVVIGADHRSWLSHLIDPSVERELLDEADFAVLVAPEVPVVDMFPTSATRSHVRDV